MDDLISRQAAIDALDFEIVHVTAYCDGKNVGNPLAQYNKGLEDGKKAIEALPSAQPEQQWIPVSETVDVPEHEVLACDRYGTELIGFICKDDEQWMCESDECIMCDVVAWMPLPKPYNAETK